MRKTVAIILTLALALTLAGCGLPAALETLLPSATTPEPTPEPTPVPLTPEPTVEPTPEPVPMTREELDQAMFDQGKLCAVAFLGFSADKLNISAPGMLATGGYNWMYPFLGDTRGVQMIEYTGCEVFAIIPRSDAALTLYDYYLSDDFTFREGIGGLLTTSRDGQTIILRCNSSDTLPNTIFTVNAGGETARYIPRISIADYSLLRTSDKILDITMYGFVLGES